MHIAKSDNKTGQGIRLGGPKESGKSVLVRKSLVKSREKGYPYRSKSTLFILVKVPSFPRKEVNWERSFPFPGKFATGKGFINFGKGSFLGKDPFLKLMNPFPVAAFPGKGKDLSQ